MIMMMNIKAAMQILKKIYTANTGQVPQYNNYDMQCGHYYH